MSGSDIHSVWIGTPRRGATQEDVSDPYTSRVGGQAFYFRVGAGEADQQSASTLSKYFQCPQCKSTAQVSLLCQVYAPLEVYDRVLYVLTCASCTNRPGPVASFQGGPPVPALTFGASKSSSPAAAAAAKSLTSFCFALRSQNFSREYFTEVQKQLHAEAQKAAEAESEKEVKSAPLFGGGDDDWGDDAGDWGTGGGPAEDPGPSPPAPHEKAGVTDDGAVEHVPKEQPAFPIASRGMIAPLKGVVYTSGLPLDLYKEPLPNRRRELSIEEQLAAVESMYGRHAELGTGDFDDDDHESPAETCVREYMEKMEQTPSQCVRWCPGGAPLRTSTMPIGVHGGSLPPPCPACGAARQFEMQLTAPVVYYLTKDIGEAKNTALHFSNVLVYTCSRNCYSAGSNPPYLPEYVVVEDEL
ncbi:hypothetical protein JKF63_01919 [Porcisia hertigi]|uniref:Programmed cell death protein 2 C-terminal domain-containing protein n=1 Tax=Porcisia hertigi TaxID=2761500 RepID=A0A836I0A4_9TRYP|nr:hypothetical protein JKF63_01919 [Porcisia hertigi]